MSATLAGIIIGSGVLYAVLAAALMAMHRAVGAVNLAFGEIATGAVLGYAILASPAPHALPLPLPLPPLVALALSVSAAACAAWLLDRFLIQPIGDVRSVRPERHAAAMVATLGASIALIGAYSAIVGPYPRRVPMIVGTPQATWPVPLAAALLAALTWMLLRADRGGKLLIAAGGNPRLASASGIHVSQVRSASLLVATAVAALAAALLFSRTGAVSAFGGVAVMFRALAVGLAAGNLSMARLLGAGIALSGAENLVAVLSPTLRDAAPFAILIAVVVVRDRLSEIRAV